MPALFGLLGVMLPFIFTNYPKKKEEFALLVALLVGSMLIGTQWGYNQLYASQIANKSKAYLIRQAEVEAEAAIPALS